MKSLQWLRAGFLLSGFFLSGLVTTVLAQNAPDTALSPKGGVAGSGRVSISVSTTPGVGFPGRVVKGVPFSADVVREFTQTLGDGNRVHRETHGAIFRDAEGRTRTEGEPEIVGVGLQRQTRTTITDPVAGTLTTLDPESKTAMVNHWRTPNAPGPVDARGAGDATKTPSELLEELRARRAAQATSETRRPKLSTEQLGTKEIEGFIASGVRNTRTLEAGAIGNERPIASITESWVSEELKTMILSLSDDPQSGQRIMRLTNIRVGDPDAQLFQIPPDYTVKDIPAREEVVVKPSTPR